jgi:hypothetical protein
MHTMDNNLTAWPPQNRAFLTRDNPQGRYLAARLAKTIPHLVIIVEESTSGTRKKIFAQLRRYRRKSLGYAILKAMEFPLLALAEIGTNQKMASALKSPKAFPASHKVIRIDNINSPASVEQLGRLHLASSLIYGTSIIKEAALAKLGKAMNCHMGIVPQYRGAKSEFWALYNRDFENVGYSLHELVRSLDAGNLLHQQKLSVISPSPAQCRVNALRDCAEKLPQIWLEQELGLIQSLSQEGEACQYSTPGIWPRLVLLCRWARTWG